MAQRTSADEADPFINMIEQDLTGDSVGPAALDERQERLSQAAREAVSARRRRDFDAALARLREKAVRDDVTVPQHAEIPSPNGIPDETNRGSAPLDQPPERVRKRYLRAGNQYFLKDAPYQLAFEDLGPYLVTEHNRPDVVESMIDMAHAKSWWRIRVSGHEVFRGEAWLQGTLLGIDVSGYEPKAADLARLADARQVRLDNRIEMAAHSGSTPVANAPGRLDDRPMVSSAPRVDARMAINRSPSFAPRRPSASESAIPEGNQNAANDEVDGPRRYVGELREHGGAPYQHNPARSASYYVVFRDETGIDQVVWGVDLERALREANAQIGQQVMLENLGKHLVTVRVPILNDEGRVIGEDEKDVYRNTWQVEVVQRGRDASVARQSDDPPGDEKRPTDLHVEPVGAPELHGRHDARHSENERALHLAVLTAAMLEQGFSQRSVARVNKRAERMLVAFQREGIPVPMPKVFDPKAPSDRNRRKHQISEHTPTPEIERTLGEPSPPSPSR
ncbi:LPD7 domain-containing protein [Burkholderia sp. BCC1993]|uniref:LPD7 domain-containing protein n=1 Tax=Burkholderia sp. BCC1993 TaxID=2817444 RepID=UPI002AB1A311|nr:LPD7 domain-containing protein [Burkholderia sp. BCC1993]